VTTARFILAGDRQRRLVADLAAAADDHTRVTFAPPKHSDDQRAKLNAMCGDLAKQATHAGLKLAKDDWRHLIAAMVFRLRIVPSLDGDGVVSLTPSTAEMTVEEMGKMIDGAEYVGATRKPPVQWSDPTIIRANPRDLDRANREGVGA
jgi:hypothetical protein